MIKKLFDWTPNDIAQWEKIREKGLRHFIVWYGIVIFGGVLFILLGLVTLLGWAKPIWGGQAGLAAINLSRLALLALELGFVALVCLAGGLVTSLATWIMEDKIYQGYKDRGL